MANANLIGSAQACQTLGVDKSTLSRLVKSGDITPKVKLPGRNGAMLFDPRDVNRLCLDRGAARAK
ncbi:helix-turn-helix transcriptional regulator [Kribbella sp. NBC_00889]|uniref:helix-turn-helix transcriptional regulator n=1 Tax=Kribbella sp. NBC_00889 TaxID=2975974 RepID=UPI00386D6453|nr:helix-turn-helix domain-containing protein [Kribbella sp. NBC_00889]